MAAIAAEALLAPGATDGHLAEWLSSGAVSLLIDGVDEVADEAKHRQLVVEVASLAESYPCAVIVLSSREAGLREVPRGFEVARLLPLTAQASELLVGTELFAEIRSDSDATELARNPLLARLLRNAFDEYGVIPSSDQRLGDYIDVALTTVAERMTRQYSTTAGAVRSTLAELALRALAAPSGEFGYEELRAAAVELNFKEEEQHAIGVLLRDHLPFVHEVSPGRFRFFHLAVLEWFAAEALVTSPRDVAEYVKNDRFDRIVEMAVPRLSDPTQLLTEAVDNRGLAFGRRLLATVMTRPGGAALVASVMDQALPAGMSIRLVGDGVERHDPHLRLADEWAALKESAAQGRDKGQLLERFMVSLFSQVFEVVSHDLDTATGELDLVLENTGEGTFWAFWGPDIQVECKHVARPVDTSAVNTFLGKVSGSRLRLFFFVSTSGFNRRALQRLELAAADLAGPLLVPITGADIEAMLDARQPVEAFLKEVLRRSTNRLPLGRLSGRRRHRASPGE